MDGRMICSAKWLTLLLVLVATPGCTETADSPQGTPADVPPATTLAQGEKVTLLEEAGDFVKVENGDGEQWYVAASLLKQRNTATAAEGEYFTHTVVRDAPSYTDLPPGKPRTLEPRSIAEISAEQLTLNGLFLSESSSKEVIAPRNVSHFIVEEQTGERCWHAYECIHPDCPGERTGGRAYYIFIQPQINTQQAIHCPACEKIRAMATETKEQWRKWGRFVRPHEPPETVRRRAELDRERRQAREAKRRRVRKEQ